MSDEPSFEIFTGDCLEAMRELEDNSVDSAVMDPPAGISFMGAKWDTFGKGGMKPETIAKQKASESRNEPFPRSGKAAKQTLKERDDFIDWLQVRMEELLRVIKPGGHILVWGLPRTSHWTATAMENAGWEVRDVISYLQIQGFPKSHNIAKGIQKLQGVEPVEVKPADLGMANNPDWNELKNQLVMPEPEGDAAQWEGWGTALKPAREDWILARKPLSEKSIARNVLKWGTGGIFIDGCRIGENAGWSYPNGRGGSGCFDRESLSQNLEEPMEATKGRFPSNVIIDEYAGAIIDMQSGKKKSGTAVRRNGKGGNIFGGSGRSKLAGPAPDHGYSDYGGASRIFYCPKPSKKEKEEGLGHLSKKGPEELTGRKEGSQGLVMKHADGSDKANPYAGTSGAKPRANTHPTVKSIALMRYLVRLVTPPGGVVIDLFMGSGTTGIAAYLEGFDFLGVEQKEEYFEIAKARLEYWRTK